MACWQMLVLKTATGGSTVGKVVSLNRLSVGCGTAPRRQSGYLVGFCLLIRVIYTVFCVNISLILNSVYNTALFD